MPLPIAALRSNVEFVRGYFRAHPAASIHEAARAAVDAKQGLHLEEISRIRRELLPELRPMGAALARQVAPLTVKPHPPLPQKPRTPVQILKEAVPLVAPPKSAGPPAVEVAPPVVAVESQSTGETMPPKKPPVPRMEVSPEDLKAGSQERGVGTIVRRRCLNAYLERHPNVSAKTCKEALESTFGYGLMLSYIQATVRIARQVRNAPHVAPPPPAAPAPAVEPARSLPPSPAPVQKAVPEPIPELQWGPPTVQQPLPASLDAELRRLAAEFRLLCEAHQLDEASLAWDTQRNVKAKYSRMQRATLEV